MPDSAIMDVMLRENRAMPHSTYFEEVRSAHVGDKILRRRRKPFSIFKAIYYSIIKLVGKLHR